MTGCLGLQRGIFTILTSLSLAAVSQTALASSRGCADVLEPVKPSTFKALRERNTEHLQEYILEHPMPGFDDPAREAAIEQIGQLAPRALQQVVGATYKLVSSPAPSAAIDTAVNLNDEGKSIPVHVDLDWAGRRTSTTVYASLPKTIRPRDGGYLVGTDYPVVLVHLHGGGTPTASGKNGMSIAQALAGQNIPVVAMDLPGHGRATRKIRGLETFQGQIDWVLALIDKIADPRVKIVLSGHSWGAEFTAFINRHSQDPKYSRIKAFLSFSAPIDVSGGGDMQKQVDFDHWFEKNFSTLKERSSPADFDFVANTIRHGKNSHVGGLFAQLTAMDFKMPRITEEERAKLTFHRVVEGQHDIITWVGREEEGVPQHGSDLIILKPGTTWKSAGPDDLFSTGHNIWDVHIPGTTKPWAYDFIGGIMHDIAGPAGFGPDPIEDAIAKIAAALAPLQEKLKDKSAPEEAKADLQAQIDTAKRDVRGELSVQMVSEYVRKYWTFFLFRQMVNERDEYIPVGTASRAKMADQRSQLERFIKLIDSRSGQWSRQVESRVLKAIDDLRIKLGIADSITAGRAKQELEIPLLTADARAAIFAYLALVNQKTAELEASTQSDTQFDAELAELNASFNKTLQGMRVKFANDPKAHEAVNLVNYRDKADDLIARKEELTDFEKNLRAELARYHQKFKEYDNGRKSRFGQARDLLLAQIQRPPGVEGYKAALRESEADQSPERRLKLRTFVDGAAVVEAEVRAAAAHEWETALAREPHPEGIATREQAVAAKSELDSRVDFTYVPPNTPEIEKLANEIKRVSKVRDEAMRGGPNDEPGIDRLDKAVREGARKRLALAKSWEGLWRKTKFTSARLQSLENRVEDLYKVYENLVQTIDFEEGNWRRELKARGELTEENLINSTPHFKDLLAKMIVARTAYLALKDTVEPLRWQEALIPGSLSGGAPGDVTKLESVAKELWGTSHSNPSPESLVASLRSLEEQLEAKRRTESLASQHLYRTQWEYSQLMEAKGEKLPFTIHRVNIREALDLSYHDLVERLASDPVTMTALKNTLDQWNGYQSLLKVESQTKDVGNY